MKKYLQKNQLIGATQWFPHEKIEGIKNVPGSDEYDIEDYGVIECSDRIIRPGDWIIQFPDKSFATCDKITFNKIYEEYEV